MIDFFKVTPKKRRVLIRSNKGVIYSNPPLPKKMVFYFGNFLFFIASGILVYLYWPILYASGRYYLASRGFQQVVDQTPPYSVSPTPGVGVTAYIDSEYLISIPKIMAESQVIASVSPFDKTEYLRVLENNVVAQAKDTSPPGSGAGNMTYIFAHSTQQGFDMVRKNAVFYLLGELTNEDQFLIRYSGNSYIYMVYDKKVVSAGEVEYLKYNDPEKEVVILQTCWPIGTDWKRLLVFAQRVN
ncbi:MAG: sortase [Candidatus Shapirobacteria bacterium]|jgi:LPXTG-site transpeptidase (sortase) family protein